MRMRVTVKTLANRTTVLQVNADDTVENFQAMLERCQGTPVSAQVLLHTQSENGNGRMQPGHLLREYGLTPEDEVLEVLLVRAMPPRPPGAAPIYTASPHFGHSGKKPGQPPGAAAGKQHGRQPQSRRGQVAPMPLPPPPPFAPPPAVPPPEPKQPQQLEPAQPQRQQSQGELRVQLAPQEPQHLGSQKQHIEGQPELAGLEQPHRPQEPQQLLRREADTVGAHHGSMSVPAPAPPPVPARRQLSQRDSGRASSSRSGATGTPVVRPPPSSLLQDGASDRASSYGGRTPPAGGAMTPGVATPPAPVAAIALASGQPQAPLHHRVQPPRHAEKQLPWVTAPTIDGRRPSGPQLPIGRPGTPRGGVPTPSPSPPPLSAPCTPRTPATPHPVASWAPPAVHAAPAAASSTRPVVHQELTAQGSTRLIGINPGIGPCGAAIGAAVTPDQGQTRPSQPPPNARIRRADLERIGRLGVGAFGVVTLEMDRRTGRTYALKAVSKGYLAQLRMEHSVLNEKRILKMVETPFIVRLLATYNGREHVYFLLEAALGGELFTTYERLRLYGSERHARFYVGCCVEALAHLHERHVIYRDLKPENLLLDARGYCKLTDMGLAKVTQSQTYTLVGTPDYMAPEVINCTGHNWAVDWWMLGVLLFELLVGRPPFEADCTEKVYESVRRGIDVVKFPPETRRAAELIRGLCHPEPEKRQRAPDVRRDQWFRSFDWAALRTLRMPAPHIPRVRGVRDLANFRCCDQEDPPRVPYKDKGTGWDLDFEDDVPAAPVAAALGALPPATAPETVSAVSSPALQVSPAQPVTSVVPQEEELQAAGNGSLLIYVPPAGGSDEAAAISSSVAHAAAVVPASWAPSAAAQHHEVRPAVQAASPRQVPPWAWVQQAPHDHVCSSMPWPVSESPASPTLGGG